MGNMHSKREMETTGTSATMEPLIPESGGVVKVIADFIVCESALLRGSEDQFIEVEKDLRELLSMRTVAEDMGRLDERLQTLVRDMQELLVQAGEVVVAFVNERKRQSDWGCFRRTIFFFRDLIARHRFQEEVETIRRSISRIRSQGTSIGIRQIDLSENIQSATLSLPLWGPYRGHVKEDVIVGRKETYQFIKSMLMVTYGYRAKQKVISIQGMEGAGKTTLADKIYRDREIVKHFTCRAWITLSQPFDSLASLIGISEQVGLKVADRRNSCDSELADGLNYFLSLRRYLIVLDNLQMIEEWKKLCMAFPDTHNGSRIIVVNHSKNVVSHTYSTISIHVPPLSLEDSWRLFRSKIRVPVQLEEVGWEIMRACAGSPLMISTAGYLLSEKSATSQEWNLVLYQMKGKNASVYESLAAAADLLPSYLKRCLYYFRLFQEGYDIPTRRLISLWVAEGLVQRDKSSDESPEVIADKYLSKLIEQNMIQVVKRKPDGSVKTCRMHDALRQAQNIAQASSSSCVDGICRLADHLNQDDDSYGHIHGDNSSNTSFRSYYRNLHTLMSFDSREGPAPGKEIGDFLQRGITNRCFQGMRVLDLERVFRPKLPESLGKLMHLRYLGLRWTYLEHLPASIDNLFNLQTLDLKHTYISTLPSSLWKMQQLRHLYLSESYRTRFVPPRGTSSLTDLQTLWGAFVDEESPLDNSLYRLTKLRKLGLTCRLTRDQQDATAEWILRLERLESLRLISIDISVKPSDLFLKPLSGLRNLTRIYLLGTLTNPAVADGFPEKLTELTLSLSRLTEDPMPKLKKLPNLKILQLLCNAFVGKSMVCSPPGFPRLQVLRLWKLEQLEEWDIKEGSLPIVEKIEIRACTALKTIPERLPHLESLHELKIKDMPQNFTRTVREVGGADWFIKHVSVTRSSSMDQQSQTSSNV